MMTCTKKAKTTRMRAKIVAGLRLVLICMQASANAECDKSAQRKLVKSSVIIMKEYQREEYELTGPAVGPGVFKPIVGG